MAPYGSAQDGSLRRSENAAAVIVAAAALESCDDTELAQLRRDCHCTPRSLRDEKHSDRQFAIAVGIVRAARPDPLDYCRHADELVDSQWTGWGSCVPGRTPPGAMELTGTLLCYLTASAASSSCNIDIAHAPALQPTRAHSTQITAIRHRDEEADRIAAGARRLPRAPGHTSAGTAVCCDHSA